MASNSDSFFNRKRQNNENMENANNVSPSKMVRGRGRAVVKIVTLAKESPARHYSDSDSYESLHDHETEWCSDTSDTCSNKSGDEEQEQPKLQVIEYEVASDSPSESLFSNESSSGTEDCDNGNVGPPVDASPDDVIFADTEDSDGPSDTEFRLADFWACVKCKNRLNKPFYRYCERCYQIRKSHFPPRPRHYKPRPNNMKRSAASRGVFDKSKFLPHTVVSSSDSESDRNPKNNVNQKSIRQPNSTGETGPSGASEIDSGEVKQGQSDFKIKNKFFENVVDVELASQSKLTPPTQLQLSNIPRIHKDSGFSSCCSSQEMSPDVPPVRIFTNCQETYSFETSKNTGIFNTNSLEGSKSFDSQKSSQCSTLSQASNTYNSFASTSGICDGASCSPSSSSEQKSDDIQLVGSMKRQSLFTNVGQPTDMGPDLNSILEPCMMCLTYPKNAVFVHKKSVHACCCYRCAVKVWNKKKRCPICNRRVYNVMKLFVC